MGYFQLFCPPKHKTKFLSNNLVPYSSCRCLEEQTKMVSLLIGFLLEYEYHDNHRQTVVLIVIAL